MRTNGVVLLKFYFASNAAPVYIDMEAISAIEHLNGSPGEYEWSRITAGGRQFEVIGDCDDIVRTMIVNWDGRTITDAEQVLKTREQLEAEADMMQRHNDVLRKALGPTE